MCASQLSTQAEVAKERHEDATAKAKAKAEYEADQARKRAIADGAA